MARKPISADDRARKVEAAALALPGAVADALAAQLAGKVSREELHALWAVVEEYGATVHRNGRLLAGKSKGG